MEKRTHGPIYVGNEKQSFFVFWLVCLGHQIKYVLQITKKGQRRNYSKEGIPNVTGQRNFFNPWENLFSF